MLIHYASLLSDCKGQENQAKLNQKSRDFYGI